MFKDTAVCRIHVSSRRELIFRCFSYINYQNRQEEKAYVLQFVQFVWISLQYRNEISVMRLKVVTVMTVKITDRQTLPDLNAIFEKVKIKTLK
jgi:hypothetical protein